MKENLKAWFGHYRRAVVEHLRLQKLASWLGRNVAVVVSISSLLIAVGTMYIAYRQMNIAVEQWSDQEDQYAWNTISRHVPGNSGIGPALEHLYGKYRDQPHFIDLRPFRSAHAQSDPPAYVGKVDLSSANLMESWLSNTDFSGSILNDANLRNAKMNQAIFSGADLINANLSNAKINGTDFSNSDLTEATLNRVKGKEVIFNDTNLRKAKLVGAYLERARLSGAILNHVEAENLYIAHATAINTEFDHAHLNDAVFQGVTGFGMSFLDAKMHGVNFTGGRFSGSSFEEAELNDADFTEATVMFADFTGADLTGANLAFANFASTNLSRATLGKIIGFKNAKWEGAWAWNDERPKLLKLDEEQIEEIMNAIKFYNPECKEDWERRIEAENGSGSERKAVIRYRPPDDRCLLSTDTRVDLRTKSGSGGAPDE